MKWQARLLKNTLFALLPFPETVRKLKRSIFPYDAAIDEWTLEQGMQQIEMLRTVGFNFRGKTVLELGTGWQPIIPLLFHLVGAVRVIMVDAQRLLDARLLKQTARNLCQFRELIAQRLGVSAEHIRHRLDISRETDLDGMLVYFGLRYLAPVDARSVGVALGSIDAITSRAVLEHIPRRTIEELFAEFRRILRDQGLMCHIIDNSDHWEHHDKSISRVNFLKFEQRTWRFTLFNPLDYQNRLRHFEYISMLKQAGFRVVKDHSMPDPVTVKALEQMTVCSKYRDVPHEQLAILTSNIIASPDRA